MSAEPIRVSPRWLELREQADAEARSLELVHELVRRLGPGPLVIHDLACGSGSMGRWLAPLLPAAQHWVLHDRDPDLLAIAAAAGPDGATVETRLSDVTRLGPVALDGASLVTASALLDLLTVDELERLVGSCAAPRCPVLIELSVTGGVLLAPADPLDVEVAAAFDSHQRRRTSRGRLLGPDAVDAAADRFRERGMEVLVRPSPWLLGPADGALAVEWLAGWLDAAVEQEPPLDAAVRLYRRRRLREAEAGALAVTVGHADLLVLP